MQLRPILSTLRHHKLTSLLLTLQVAFTCAIVCNVAFMVAKRAERASVATGIVENELSVIHSSGIEKNENKQARNQADLAALRAIPGVTSVAAVSYSLPLNHNSSSRGVCPDQASLQRAMQQRSADGTSCMTPSIYDGTPGLIDTLGLHLVAGRRFQPDDYVVGMGHTPAVAIISSALARRLYPNQSALGKDMYLGHSVIRVVGIVETLLRPSLRDPGTEGDSMLWPQLPDLSGVTYLLRSAPGDRRRVLEAAEAALLKVSASRLIDPRRVQTYSQIRHDYFQRDTTMIGLLVASASGLLFVTALGIAGLANFWVQQRWRSIGITVGPPTSTMRARPRASTLCVARSRWHTAIERSTSGRHSRSSVARSSSTSTSMESPFTSKSPGMAITVEVARPSSIFASSAA